MGMDDRHARAFLRRLARESARASGAGRRAVRLAARSMAVGGTRWDRSAYNAFHPCARIPCACDDVEQEA